MLSEPYAIVRRTDPPLKITEQLVDLDAVSTS